MNLSVSGKNFPSFLKSLSDSQKGRFLEKLRQLSGNRIEDVTSTEISDIQYLPDI